MAIRQDDGMSERDDKETRLQELLKEARHLDDAFDVAVETAGYADRWALFRTGDHGWPVAVETAWQAVCAAYDAFYTLRFGDKGVLGSKGL